MGDLGAGHDPCTEVGEDHSWSPTTNVPAKSDTVLSVARVGDVMYRWESRKCVKRSALPLERGPPPLLKQLHDPETKVSESPSKVAKIPQ